MINLIKIIGIRKFNQIFNLNMKILIQIINKIEIRDMIRYQLLIAAFK